MSTNLSKEKRDNLINKIKQIRDFISAAPQDENTGNLLTYLSELEKDVKGKKYGLVFEEHKENIDTILETHTPVLTEEGSLFIDNGGELNFLIEGDNLASLKLLKKTHKGKVDVIYIDPPYNTGNKDFIYNDSYVSTEDSYKHSKWLSFMKRRLVLAKQLLTKQGVVFISIDDNEINQLKLLCDEIFNEENFISILPRITKKSGKDHCVDIAKNHDYILAYYREKSCDTFCGIKSEDSDYPLFDEYYDERGGYKLNQTLDYDSLWYNPKMDFPIDINGQCFYPGGSKENQEKRHRGEHKQKDWVWRWSKEKFDFGYKNGFVVIKTGRDGNPRIYTKTYLNATISNSKPYRIELKSRETHLSSLALTDNCFSNDNAKKEITKVKLDDFGFPKPTALIEQLIRILKKSRIVLDFFAGSGTTGHAVMKLNAEDGGNRKFILCTNNENNICRDITYERIKRVIDKEDYKASLKYYKVDYVPISDKLYYEYADELLLHVKELVELENGVNFTNNSSLAILLTEEDVSEFISNEITLARCDKIYLGHDVLLTGEQEKLIELNKIELNIIPEYYYKDLEA